MKTITKLALTAVAAGITVASAAQPVSVYAGQKTFEETLNKMSSNPNVSYENVEKGYSDRKDKIVVKVDLNDEKPYEIVVNMNTSFSIKGSHSEFAVDYESSFFKKLNEYIEIKQYPENKGFFDFDYLSALGTVTFENKPFSFKVKDEDFNCDVGTYRADSRFTKEQIEREYTKVVEYLTGGASAIPQKSGLDFVKCYDTEKKNNISIGSVKSNGEGIMLSFMDRSDLTLSNIVVDTEELGVSVDSAVLGFSLENTQKKANESALTTNIKISGFKFNKLSESLSGGLTLPKDYVINSIDHQLVLNKITDKNIKLISDMLNSSNDTDSDSMIEEMMKDQVVDARTDNSIKTSHGDLKLDVSVASKGVESIMEEHDVNIEFAASKKLLDVYDKSASAFLDSLVMMKYLKFENDTYTATVTIKNGKINANGAEINMENFL